MWKGHSSYTLECMCPCEKGCNNPVSNDMINHLSHYIRGTIHCWRTYQVYDDYDVLTIKSRYNRTIGVIPLPPGVVSMRVKHVVMTNDLTIRNSDDWISLRDENVE